MNRKRKRQREEEEEKQEQPYHRCILLFAYIRHALHIEQNEHSILLPFEIVKYDAKATGESVCNECSAIM